MDKEIVSRLHSSFEDLVQRDPQTGTEFWCGSDHFRGVTKMVG